MWNREHTERTRGWRRAPALIGLLCSLLAGAVVLEACSIERDYKTLSFFFDGVPDPNKPRSTEEALTRSLSAADYRNMTSEERGALLARRVATPEISYHEPSKQKLCEECHVFERSGKEGGFSVGIPRLIAPPEELCLKCHERPKGKFVHGPAANGSCSFCHVPHQSLYPHLLRTERPRELCASCHTRDWFVTASEHEAYGDQACTSCHDPHASEFPALLRTLGTIDDENPGADDGGTEVIDDETTGADDQGA